MSATITEAQDFQKRIVLYGLVYEDEQFRISSNAVVRARLTTTDGKTAITDWVTRVHNDTQIDDWGLSILNVVLDGTAYTSLPYRTVTLEINVAGPYVNREGTDSSESYNKTWNQTLTVDRSPA